MQRTAAAMGRVRGAWRVRSQAERAAGSANVARTRSDEFSRYALPRGKAPRRRMPTGIGAALRWGQDGPGHDAREGQLAVMADMRGGKEKTGRG